MDEQSINTMREDLTKNFYTLAQSHSDEIRKLLEKFDDDQLQFTMELEADDREQTQPSKTQLEEAQPEQVLISHEEELIDV